MAREEKITPAKKDSTNDDSVVEISKTLLEQDPLVRTVNKVIADGVEQRASDILIEPLDEQVQIRYRIDGILYRYLMLPKQFQDGVLTRVKVMSGLDISEHRLPQDGRFKMFYKKSEVDFRVSVIPSSLGEKIVLRILDKTKVTLDINKLGFDNFTLEVLKRNLTKPFGMILACGPTGCGKTTTLYSALKEIDSIEKNIITVEDPVEYQLFGINQVAVHEDIGMTFASALRSILRQDPDIILVGEIRDFETADISVKAALTGHLLLSTLHTTSAIGSVVRLVNMGIEPFLISSACLLVLSQVLARSLCPQCKEAYPAPTHLQEEFEALHIPLPKGGLTLYKNGSCNACNNTGFKGRIALAETLEITNPIKDLIIANASEQDMRQQAAKDGFTTLRENGFKLVVQGMTTVEEVLRVTSL
ncbi:MAG: type II/IV secretion system protein [Candidatus Omnitrophota bacterium]|jgi:type IV pilus assembly protein PilB|nr:MAG: type II/IV secretion system protein [Candidatus Omnitrophota bacterium]